MLHNLTNIKMELFLNIISITLGSVTTFILALALYFNLTYANSTAAKLDKLQGYKTYWPVKGYAIIALICWAWVLAQPLSA